MTDPLDAMFDPPDGPRPGAAPPRRCRHPRDMRVRQGEDLEYCRRCQCTLDPRRQSLGRRARHRGNAIQRKRIEGLGGQNLAGNNQNLDGLGSRFRYESKSGGSFSERYWRWLKGIPLGAGQAGVLIVTDTPGPGHRARSIVVVDYETWRDEHGE